MVSKQTNEQIKISLSLSNTQAKNWIPLVGGSKEREIKSNHSIGKLTQLSLLVTLDVPFNVSGSNLSIVTYV